MDLALSLDPRIKRIKQEEKEARTAKKNQRVNGVVSKQALEDEKKKQEEEAKKKEEDEKVTNFACSLRVDDLFIRVFRRLLERLRRRRKR